MVVGFTSSYTLGDSAIKIVGSLSPIYSIMWKTFVTDHDLLQIDGYLHVLHFHIQ